ncbi:hypothetical protein ACHHYP_07052 [Achlya hypogyna]|uniref:Transmembrane protein 230 n=1 Tax=Achlya hypogyna TaxID=1202772 RepID=A0A1V9YR01_ACHHY|nr:hypothetical protein ACHHYP_07052 [Achlya hypogyna]
MKQPSMEEVDLEKAQDRPSSAPTEMLESPEGRSWWTPKFQLDPRVPIKTTIAAVAMLLTGIGLLIWGIVFAAEGRGLGHLLLGCLTVIPGAYGTVQLYGAYKGWRGYAFTNLPSYDT